MTAVTSEKPGYLKSERESVDPELAMRLHIHGLTKLPLTSIRRAFSVRQGSLPAVEDDWCSVHIRDFNRIGTPYNEKLDEETTLSINAQSMTFLCSFYGPRARELAYDLMLGSCQRQNDVELRRNGLTVTHVGEDVLRIPELYGERWRDRYDVHIKCSLSTRVRYAVKSVKDARPHILSD